MSEPDVELILTRLREEVRGRGRGAAARDGDARSLYVARQHAERFWPVTADRPFLHRPGRWGRIRGRLLAPVKVVLRKLMRWYVEPAFVEQREFNNAVLKLIDGLSERIDGLGERIEMLRETSATLGAETQSLRGGLDGLDRRIEELDERTARLERRSTAAQPRPAASQEAVPPVEADGAFDYFAFESRMRGSRESVSERQRDYVDDFRDAEPVLDIGCGRGEFLALLRDTGVAARGIDADAGMVEFARGEGLEVEQADAATYLDALPDGSLGGIFCSHVVEHLRPPAIVHLLDLAAAKLRPDGVLAVETPNPQSLSALPTFFADLTHVQPLHPETLSFLVRQAGFRHIDVRFFRAPPQEERLRTVPLPRERRFDGAREALDANVDRLNDVVFGPQDFAVVAHR